MTRRYLPVLAALLVGCTVSGAPAAPDTDPADTVPAPGGPPNVLVLLMDDVGVDAVSTYGVQPLAPATPTLDRLAAEGVRFNRAWAMPVCTPTRAALLTGRLPHRTGIGAGIGPFDATGGLPLAERTIAELLRDAPTPYATTAIGKWHLSSADTGGLDAPNQQGFDHYRGAIANLLRGQTTDGKTPSYTRWEETHDGQVAWRTGYITEAEVDDALEAIRTLPEPWFVYVAFHAAHAPYDPPPGTTGVAASKAAQYAATVAALDAEMGRLLDEMGPDRLDRTMVVALGDNGTPPAAALPPFDQAPAKFTMFEGGIRVPFVVRWPGVAQPGTTSDALVSVIDVLPTIAAAAGLPASALPTLDGVDLGPALRDPAAGAAHALLFTEEFLPNGVSQPRLAEQYAVRDARWKLIRFPEAGDYLFDLDGLAVEGDPVEITPGSPEEATRDRLSAGLDAILATMPADPAP